MTDPVIQIEGVAKSFGATVVLKDMSLTVQRGETFAFLGRNGAGKTTTIQMLLGLLQPDGGSLRVLGLDPRRDALEVRRRVGYLAEDQVMWGWMRVEQLLSFIAPFYPSWDKDLALAFLNRFGLPRRTRVRHLSKGQTVRLALLLALAHRPELVILDDPTLGLDPIARKEFIRDVIDHLQGSGATVFFSSHLLYEIEPIADVIAILDKGRIVRQASTEQLRESVKRLVLPVSTYSSVPSFNGVLDVRRSERQVGMVVEDAAEALGRLGAAGVHPEVVDMNLDEIFEAYVIGQHEEHHDSQPVLERVG